MTRQEAIAKRMAQARDIFAKYPDKISEENKRAILAQRVILGMSPYEAHLAAGAFAFRVIADPVRWPSNANPYDVMWAQSLQPDDSGIWMTFETDTQFPGRGDLKFIVTFRGGKASDIAVVE